MRIAREEIFGPVLVAQPFEDLEEVARARQRHRVRARRRPVDPRHLARPTSSPALLKAGSVYINTWGAGDPAAPFGGYKASGIGREKGHHNLDAYLETEVRLHAAVGGFVRDVVLHQPEALGDPRGALRVELDPVAAR